METPNLPALANPRLAEIPTPALHWWSAHFEMRMDAAEEFDEVYAAQRTTMMLLDELLNRSTLAPSAPWVDDPDIDDRLLDCYLNA